MSAALEVRAREMFPYQGADHKAWRKRIMWRLEQGDKTLSMVQVNFAKMALNVQEVAA
jgi:hypothetical protein